MRMARTPTHPGEILAEEIEAIGLTAKRLAELIQVPPQQALSAFGRETKNNRRHGVAARPVLRHVRRFLDELAECV